MTPVVRLGAVVLAGVVVLGCGGRRDAAIIDAVLEGERTLVLSISACNAGENRVSTNESPDIVTVSVTTDDPVGGDDCADGLTVRLVDPFGDRDLIDGATGKPVEVRREP